MLKDVLSCSHLRSKVKEKQRAKGKKAETFNRTRYEDNIKQTSLSLPKISLLLHTYCVLVCRNPREFSKFNFNWSFEIPNDSLSGGLDSFCNHTHWKLTWECKQPKQNPCNKVIVNWRSVFCYRSGEVTSASILVKKLVAVLESTEKLPVFTYECPGSGLQVCIKCK